VVQIAIITIISIKIETMEATPPPSGRGPFSIEKDGNDRVPLLYNFILYITFVCYIFLFLYYLLL
jgi:hypothetical protein